MKRKAVGGVGGGWRRWKVRGKISAMVMAGRGSTMAGRKVGEIMAGSCLSRSVAGQQRLFAGTFANPVRFSFPGRRHSPYSEVYPGVRPLPAIPCLHVARVGGRRETSTTMYSYLCHHTMDAVRDESSTKFGYRMILLSTIQQSIDILHCTFALNIEFSELRTSPN
jgi:hypothetical protein